MYRLGGHWVWLPPHTSTSLSAWHTLVKAGTPPLLQWVTTPHRGALSWHRQYCLSLEMGKYPDSGDNGIQTPSLDRSVNYSDRVKSLWFPVLSIDFKISWCSCSSGMEWHSPVEVSGIILLGFFIPTWGSGVSLQAFGSTTANCIMDNASTRTSTFGFEGKGQPESLDTFLSATRQPTPGKLLPVRLPLSFAFSK